MKIILNPDKSVVNKAKKAIRKSGGWCPACLDQNIKCKCKHEPCIAFKTSDQTICPLEMWVKEDN